MTEVALRGCRATPLLSYLKAIGVLRLVAEQAEPEAAGWWVGDHFHLSSQFDEEGLVHFFATRYRPSPVVSPWNGGSGFYPKDNADARTRLLASDDPRLTPLRAVFIAAQQLVAEYGLSEAPKKEKKAEFLTACRERFPDEALPWLDAAVVLGEEILYPPLLGTGGNDGRLEFSLTFHGRVLDALEAPEEATRSALSAALFGDMLVSLSPAAVGQFDPGGAGGANSTSGYSGASLVNPWDYVLGMEGAIAFAAAAARRLGRRETRLAAFPFTVQHTHAGFGTSADREKSRGEIWMPLWPAPTTFPELRALVGEGRAQWGRSQAQTGLDFARAAASLGVDRGISEFIRYGIVERYGRAYLCVPLARVRVANRAGRVSLLHDLDAWLSRLRWAAARDDAPARHPQALRDVERAIMALTSDPSGPGRMQDVLIAAGRAERVIATSPRFRDDAGLIPLGGLRSDWVDECDDGRPEFRLAVALASLRVPGTHVSFRTLIEPVVGARGTLRWTDSPTVPWDARPLAPALADVLARQQLDAFRATPNEASARDERNEDTSWPDEHRVLSGQPAAGVADALALLHGTIDEKLLRALVQGLVTAHLIFRPPRPPKVDGIVIPPAFAILAPFFNEHRVGQETLHPRPGWAAQLAAGTPSAVLRVLSDALLRLRLAGRPPIIRRVEDLEEALPDGRRLAASLLPTLPHVEVDRLLDRIAPRNDGSRMNDNTKEGSR
jgi:CRISPR-associated protein Csx17